MNQTDNFVGGLRKDGSQWHIQARFTNLIDESLTPVTAVIAIALIENKIVAIKNSRGWDLPGGHLEDSELPEDALRRELLEEAGMQLKTAKLMAYLCTDYDPNRPSYMLVYKVTGDLIFPYRPVHEVKERELLLPQIFLEKYSGGSKELIKALLNSRIVDF